MDSTFSSTQRPQGHIIGTLDIGTSKVSCLIARIYGEGQIEIIGVGHHASQGIKSGTIVDLKAASTAIGQAVGTAENMARPRMNGQTLKSVLVNVPGVHVKSRRLSVDMRISGQEITERDVRRALTLARNVETPDEDELIHSIPASFSIDGHGGIKHPRGMFGQKLGVELNAVTAASTALRNISTCVENNHLDIDGFCVGSYASGLACLVEDEMELGCTVVDMGGGTTSLSVFAEKNLIYSSAIPVGGTHVTSDIARGLTTTLADAERIKVLYGHAMASSLDEGEMIDVPQIGEERDAHPHTVSKSLLMGIIQPRLEETMELIRAKLEDNGLSQIAGRRVILTGGASQLSGIREMAQLVLDKQVRLGRPNIAMKGLPEAASGPAFSTNTGLLVYAARYMDQHPLETLSQPVADQQVGLLFRVGDWLKEHW